MVIKFVLTIHMHLGLQTTKEKSSTKFMVCNINPNSLSSFRPFAPTLVLTTQTLLDNWHPFFN
jgi:hypothetical protein